MKTTAEAGSSAEGGFTVLFTFTFSLLPSTLYAYRLRHSPVALRHRADGGHDRHGISAAREAARRLRARRHRNGERRGAGSWHRPHARVRRVHGRGATGL